MHSDAVEVVRVDESSLVIIIYLRLRLARYNLIGYTVLLCNHIVVLDHLGTLPVRTAARLAADLGAPSEVFVELKLDQGEQKDTDEEVADQDYAVALQVVPAPDLRRDLARDDHSIVRDVLLPRADEQGARG